MGWEPRADCLAAPCIAFCTLGVRSERTLGSCRIIGKAIGSGKGWPVIEGVAGGGGGHCLGTRVWVSLGWILAEKQSPGEHPQRQKRGALTRFFPWLSRRGRGGRSPRGKTRSGSPQFELLGPRMCPVLKFCSSHEEMYADTKVSSWGTQPGPAHQEEDCGMTVRRWGQGGPRHRGGS